MNNNKYQLGKIYTIRHPDTDKFYIGSTCEKYLSRRLAGHKRQYIKKISTSNSKILFNFGVDGCYIELFENYPCNDKNELQKREGELIRLYKDNLVNKQLAGRTPKQYSEDNKEKIRSSQKIYRDNHKEEIKEMQNEWRENNKDELKIKKKEYRETNKDKIKEHKKEFYEINKKIIYEKRKVKYECICGSKISIGKKSIHEQSQKHKKALINNIII